jgi:hypothetical protein
MPLPPVSLVRRLDTHRLVPSRYLPRGDSVLAVLAADDEQLQAIFELDGATNDRLLTAQGRLPGIGVEELVSGVPHAAVVNAAFCHPHPLGARFNGPARGAWYAAFELETSQAEVAFHKTVQLAEIGRFDDSVTYDDYLADFSASFHDLRTARDDSGGARASGETGGSADESTVRVRRGVPPYLDPESYVASQRLAERLLDAGSLGVVYPSVRRAGGTCVACFRPALVGNVRRAQRYRFTWDGTPEPEIRVDRAG